MPNFAGLKYLKYILYAHCYGKNVERSFFSFYGGYYTFQVNRSWYCKVGVKFPSAITNKIAMIFTLLVYYVYINVYYGPNRATFQFQVRLQTMPKPAPGQEPLYKGTVDCVLKTVKGEGVRGLYKGEDHEAFLPLSCEKRGRGVV